VSNKKTGDLFPSRQLHEPSQVNYKNNPIPNINNNPATTIIKGAICLSSIGLLLISYSWGNRVPFGMILFTLFSSIKSQYGQNNCCD
jgi:hypothetical protein